ncbi:MAG: DNRLRE domain-containing protein [bacterium]|nr:DNRLRE domain-containing protein [bacterium]
MKRLLGALLFFLAFVSVSPANAVTIYYQPTPYPMTQTKAGTHVVSGWFNNSFNQTLAWDDVLQIGGWSDYYTSPLKFDVTGLPSGVTGAYLYLYALPSGSANPSQVSMYRVSSSWDPSTVGWANFPSVDAGYYWPVSTAVNTFRGYTITGWYTDWKNNTHANNGVILWPYNNDGTQRFDKFVSSKSTDDGKRPILRLDFTPSIQLKSPLPGNHAWLVTTEVGGWDCKGDWYDKAHDGSNYFSVDFSWRNVADSGATIYGSTSNIPVLAAAGGKVIIPSDSGPTFPNGNYVVIDHDYDGNPNTGITTRYLHLKNTPAVISGQMVLQGDQIGVMGTTGQIWNSSKGIWEATSTGVHLHFGARYNDSGASTISELTRVLMDGWILKSFQTECLNNDWNRYYRSLNRAY